MSSPFIPCLLDLQKFLSSKEFLCDWKLHTCLPAQQSAIADWENRNCCQLPVDLKAFYLTSDGMHFSYSAKCGEAKSKIGSCRINSLDSLRPIMGGFCDLGQDKPSLSDADADSTVSLTSAARGDCRIFELETLEWPGHVCLAIKSGSGRSATVYLLDRAMRFHLLADCFQDYYALALIHLGLLQWQLCLTDVGPTPGAREWLRLLAPLRLELDEAAVQQMSASSSSPALTLPDFGDGLGGSESGGLDRERVFRGKLASAATSGIGDKKFRGGGATGSQGVGGIGGAAGARGAPNPVRRFAATTKAAMAKSAVPLAQKK